MKRIAAIAIAVFLFLFSVSAFADTSNNSNLIPVQDSNIQSSGWSNYIPAQGNGISGAAILQDSSTNQSLTRQWVHEGGYMQVTKQVAVPKTVWVQSQEWVPPVTHQEWVPPVTHQVWVQPPGQYELPGHWETVVDQPGYWKTVIDQPGYWKDTSHWETTVTYETVKDVQYTKSPHWTDYEKIIPQYQLKD